MTYYGLGAAVRLCWFPLYFFLTSLHLLLQLNSGYYTTAGSGGLPGGQITLNIQKVGTAEGKLFVVDTVYYSVTFLSGFSDLD